MGIKTQGKISAGIAFIVIGLVVFSFGMFGFIMFFKSDSSQMNAIFIAPTIVFFLISFLTVGVGAINLAKGIKGRGILINGHKSTGTILEKYHMTSRQNHAHITHYIIISYKGDSNQEHKLRVQLDYRNFYCLERGMVIECYVLGEDAYVDLSKEVRIISEAGVNYDFDGSMF